MTTVATIYETTSKAYETVSDHYHSPIEVDVSKGEGLGSRATTAVTGRQSQGPIVLEATNRPIVLSNPSSEPVTSTREIFREASFQNDVVRPLDTARVACANP